MSDNNEVVIEIETDEEKTDKPEFLIDDSESEEESETSSETEERTLETVEAELEAVKEDFKKQLEEVAESEREQFEEERERLLRTAAEAENAKRRIESEAEKHLKFANRSLIEGLIPVLDSLEAAIKSVDEKVETDEATSDITTFRDGVELVQKQFMDVLRIQGLTQIESSSKKFDPNKHEAVFATDSEDVPDGEIIEEFRCGYQLHDQIIRAAQVVVSKGKAEKEIPIEIVDNQKQKNGSEEE